jgi:CTP synthase
MFCNVKPDCVIENLTIPCLYDAPLMLHKNGLDSVVCRELKLETKEPDLSVWEAMTEKIKSMDKEVKIAIVGKYVRLHDAYLSISEALSHAGYEFGAAISILWIDSDQITEENVGETLKDANGILIPGGFGSRGIEGKIIACRYARENNIPYLGICLGMQVAVIEFARNVCGLADADSGEFNPDSSNLVINLMEDQLSVVDKGGTMRLGAYPCKIKHDSLMHDLYKVDLISERHRHRYEYNNRYRQPLEENGMKICGTSPDNILVEAVEIPSHSFFIGVQFHPEFKSRPNRPHPLFSGFVNASLDASNLCK